MSEVETPKDPGPPPETGDPVPMPPDQPERPPPSEPVRQPPKFSVKAAPSQRR